MKNAFLWSIVTSIAFLVLQQIASNIFLWKTFSLTEMPLVILVFMIVWGADQRFILLTAFFTGILMDLWSGNGLGTITLSLTISAALGYSIFQRMLTNKSATALLILGISTTLLYRGSIFLINIFQFLQRPALISRALLDMGARSLAQILSHSVILLILFIIGRTVTKRFHPYYVHKA